MKLYIELLVILAIMIIFIFWALWNSWSRRRALKKYKPENDKTKKGGSFDNGATGTTEQGIDAAVINTVGLEQLERGQLLQKADISDAGEDSPRPRKDSSGIRKLLRRRRK